MAAAKLELTDETEAEQVIRWRLSELERAGYDWHSGVLLAARTDIDLHASIELVRSGCPPATAVSILL